MIDQISFCTLDLRIDEGSNIPFVGDSHNSYVSVGVGMFKDSSLMVTFPNPTPPHSSTITPINMISPFTSGSLGYSFDP